MKTKSKRTQNNSTESKKFLSILLASVFLVAVTFYYVSQKSTNKKETVISEINIKNYQFMPASIKIKAGQPLVFINRDSVIHNVYGNADREENELMFVPDLKTNEGKMTTAPQTPGVYNFHCHIHPEMKFNLIVE